MTGMSGFASNAGNHCRPLVYDKECTLASATPFAQFASL